MFWVFVRKREFDSALIKSAVLNFSKMFVYFKVNNCTCLML